MAGTQHAEKRGFMYAVLKSALKSAIITIEHDKMQRFIKYHSTFYRAKEVPSTQGGGVFAPMVVLL